MIKIKSKKVFSYKICHKLNLINFIFTNNNSAKLLFCRLTMTDEERAKMAKKNDKKKPNKKVVDIKTKQDAEFKERIIREERIRLQQESYKKKLVN